MINFTWDDEYTDLDRMRDLRKEMAGEIAHDVDLAALHYLGVASNANGITTDSEIWMTMNDSLE